MDYKSYQHVQRFGMPEVQGIEQGVCWAFPKIDGTNGTIWLGDDGKVKVGSRKRILNEFNGDNAGFWAEMKDNEQIAAYLKAHPTHRLYGEWLVKHTVTTYCKDAWRKFYIFDVWLEDEQRYLSYEEYQPLLEEFGLMYIPPLKVIENGTYSDFTALLSENTYLIEQGSGVGEGVVIKNYTFENQYGKQTWAKIVNAEFLEKHGIGDLRLTEQKIVDEFVTAAFVEKEFAKLVNDVGEWNPCLVPQLFDSVFHTLVTEEMWHILVMFRRPIVNFNQLSHFTREKVKSVKSDIFGGQK